MARDTVCDSSRAVHELFRGAQAGRLAFPLVERRRNILLLCPSQLAWRAWAMAVEHINLARGERFKEFCDSAIYLCVRRLGINAGHGRIVAGVKASVDIVNKRGAVNDNFADDG